MKPAGAAADRRAVAAMVAIKSTADQDFAGLAGAWCGVLLQEGGVFRRTSDKTVFLSLGFVHQSVLLWRLTEVGVAWQVYLCQLAAVTLLCPAELIYLI